MFVPGSILGVNHSFSWYAIVKEKTTGKQWTYWINGSQWTREKVAEFVRTYYSNVEVVTIDRCTAMPTKAIQPVPAHHFQLGVFKGMEEFDKPRNPIPLLSRSTIPRNNFIRKLVTR